MLYAVLGGGALADILPPPPALNFDMPIAQYYMYMYMYRADNVLSILLDFLTLITE